MGFHHPPPLDVASQVEQSFSYTGALEVSTSPPFRCRSKLLLVQILVSLDVAGSTSTVVDIYRNDLVVHSITVSSSVEDQSETVLLSNEPDVDRWQVGIATAGAGANGLTVQLRWE